MFRKIRKTIWWLIFGIPSKEVLTLNAFNILNAGVSLTLRDWESLTYLEKEAFSVAYDEYATKELTMLSMAVGNDGFVDGMLNPEKCTDENIAIERLERWVDSDN